MCSNCSIDDSEGDKSCISVHIFDVSFEASHDFCAVEIFPGLSTSEKDSTNFAQSAACENPLCDVTRVTSLLANSVNMDLKLLHDDI